MEGFEGIEGKGRFTILEGLQSDKTLIKMSLLDKDYERLTIVTGIRTRNNTPFFLIDYPGGFRETVADLEVWSVVFQFTGKDKLQYVFRTSGGEIHRNEIWIRFPKVIERGQRRRHFRLEVPFGTKLHFQLRSSKRELSVSNVSLGGVLGAIVSSESGTQKGQSLRSGDILEHIQLEFPSSEEDLRVHIIKARVVRWEDGPLASHKHYAIQFIEMDKSEEAALTELVYKFQREFLRRRLPVSK
jgi:c-di-GMP-binding flagellar brake protein YcgR